MIKYWLSLFSQNTVLNFEYLQLRFPPLYNKFFSVSMNWNTQIRTYTILLSFCYTKNYLPTFKYWTATIFVNHNSKFSRIKSILSLSTLQNYCLIQVVNICKVDKCSYSRNTLSPIERKMPTYNTINKPLLIQRVIQFWIILVLLLLLYYIITVIWLFLSDSTRRCKALSLSSFGKF